MRRDVQWERMFPDELERRFGECPVVCYHVRAAEAIGFKAAIFLTGHYGPNWKDLKTILALIQPHVGGGRPAGLGRLRDDAAGLARPAAAAARVGLV